MNQEAQQIQEAPAAVGTAAALPLYPFKQPIDVPNLNAEGGIFKFYRYVRTLDQKNREKVKILGLDAQAFGKFHYGPLGGACVYFEWDPEHEKAEMAFSICNSSKVFKLKGNDYVMATDDTFSKKAGRQYAMKAFGQSHSRYTLMDVDTNKSMIHNVYDALVGIRLKAEAEAQSLATRTEVKPLIDETKAYFDLVVHGVTDGQGNVVFRKLSKKEIQRMGTLERVINQNYWLDPMTGKDSRTAA